MKSPLFQASEDFPDDDCLLVFTTRLLHGAKGNQIPEIVYCYIINGIIAKLPCDIPSNKLFNQRIGKCTLSITVCFLIIKVSKVLLIMYILCLMIYFVLFYI